MTRRVSLRMHDPAATAPLWMRIVTIALGLAVSAIVVGLSSSSPGIYSSMWAATFGSSLGLTQVGQLATPLILAGLAVAIGRRVGLWNVGVDGQLLMGAWAATFVAFHAGGLPGPLLVVLMMFAGLLGGAVWALLPALTRAYLSVNEVITTLMLNFVAALWLSYWTTGPWAANGAQLGSLSTRQVPAGTYLHQFSVGSVTIGLGLVIAVVAVVVAAIALRWLRLGYYATLASGEEATARYAGVSQRGAQLWGFLVSGAIGGFAGVVVELDQVHRYSSALTSNTGYIGLIIAVLAATSLLGLVPVGVLMAVVVAAGNGLRIAGISSDLVLFVTGVLLLFAGAADVAARYRLRVGAPPGAAPVDAVEPPATASPVMEVPPS
ncbi:MAG: ABC transporter permease [Actinobacteria bacterium]|nr:ABC transporter permease [Actinomycetota bacterium]